MRRVVPTTFPPILLTGSVGLGAAVRSTRTHSGLTIAEAAEMLGVAKQTLQDLETGTGTVGVGLALRIAQELGVSFFQAPSSERDIVAKAIDESRTAEDSPPVRPRNSP